VSWTLAAASVLGGLAPLLMAVCNPSLPYWYEAFPAQVLYPFCIDFVYVISAIVISDSFPARDQALAGAVFNTIANLGQALGLALVAILTNAVTQAHEGDPAGTALEQSVQAVLVGYRAGFWAAFASMLLTAGIGAWGLRKTGAVGIKRD
jgi:membrane protease YdiL (CAAX protease family)